MQVADVDTVVSRMTDTLPRGAADSSSQPSHPYAMLPPVVHRMVERQAAIRGDVVAIRDGDRQLTWRELNGRANAVARALMESGLRRGDVAQVEMPLGADLAVVLLAVLKAGGCYTWSGDRETSADAGCVLIVSQGADRTTLVHVSQLLAGATRSNPNLPVMVRGSDAACLLHEDGTPVLVPHASLAALGQTQRPQAACWTGEPGALDLWMLLTAGVTATVAMPCARAAA